MEILQEVIWVHLRLMSKKVDLITLDKKSHQRIIILPSSHNKMQLKISIRISKIKRKFILLVNLEEFN
jgi:hypothetical protein